MKITVGLTSGSRWGNGRPIRTEQCSDGRRRHHLEDGRIVTVTKPTYVLNYLSTWVDATPGETYEVRVALIGLSHVNGFYEAWNFDIDELRHYAFKKSVKLTHVETGETFSMEELTEQAKRWEHHPAPLSPDR